MAANKRALAVVAHPDDIELMMGGTLMLLGRAGYETHYLNVANGSCGTASTPRDEIVVQRTGEARNGAAALGAVFHEPLVDDLQVYYTPELVARVGAVMREVAPEILLAQSPVDYMEDHTNSCRLAVTAAFCRGMCNFVTDPVMPTVENPVAVYHALPWGLKDPLRNPVRGDIYVDVASVLQAKRDALACHVSQKVWLDESQGLDSYLTDMVAMCAAVGALSGKYEYAEGWQRHSHLGFGPEDFDPLSEALTDLIATKEKPNG